MLRRPRVPASQVLDRVLVLEPSELEVGALVWANSVLATEAALDRVKELAS